MLAYAHAPDRRKEIRTFPTSLMGLAIRTARDTVLARGAVQHPTDDLKPAAQAVHQAVRAELQMPRADEMKHAFMRDVLAPLVAPGTPEYEELRCNIFGQ